MLHDIYFRDMIFKIFSTKMIIAKFVSKSEKSHQSKSRGEHEDMQDGRSRHKNDNFSCASNRGMDREEDQRGSIFAEEDASINDPSSFMHHGGGDIMGVNSSETNSARHDNGGMTNHQICDTRTNKEVHSHFSSRQNSVQHPLAESSTDELGAGDVCSPVIPVQNVRQFSTNGNVN